MTSHRIRPARPSDVPEIFAMIRELAAFERSLDEVESSEELLHAALFADDPAVWAILVEQVGDDGGVEVAGFAVWFRNFFTWTAKHSIYLDDLYVRPQFRGRGYGKALLQSLVATCVERGYPRLDWWVLDWNESAVAFYRSIGAVAKDDWTVWRLTGDALRSFSEAP